MTLEYVKDRKQFGVPVGSFQAVAHRCAQMLLHTESARSTAYFAAWAADAEPGAAGRGGGAGRGRGGRPAGARSRPRAIQAHGGIGFTWEADVHWLYKRAQLDPALLGGAGRHHAALARAAAAAAGGAGVVGAAAGQLAGVVGLRPAKSGGGACSDRDARDGAEQPRDPPAKESAHELLPADRRRLDEQRGQHDPGELTARTECPSSRPPRARRFARPDRREQGRVRAARPAGRWSTTRRRPERRSRSPQATSRRARRRTATSPPASRWLRSATTGPPSTSTLAELERELDELREPGEAPPTSITEEIERIGEQTASILVVAHDQAHETTRLAQEQAERCIADAAANAVADHRRGQGAAARARRRDRRGLARARAAARGRARRVSGPGQPRQPGLRALPRRRAPPSSRARSTRWPRPRLRTLWEEIEYLAEGEATEADQRDAVTQAAAEPQATQPFDALSADDDEESMEPQPGDTGSWLAGLEPPDVSNPDR